MQQPARIAVDDEIEIAMRAARIFAGVTAESIAQAGDTVTVPQLRVLVLAASRDSLNTTAVAEELDVHLSNASRICDRLVAAGWLNRRESPADRRNVELSLTVEGEALLSSVMSHRRAAFTRILKRIPADDRTTLARGLQALCDAADDYAEHRATQF
jgi:DNA-binding MarR family transcriptional regulator